MSESNAVNQELMYRIGMETWWRKKFEEHEQVATMLAGEAIVEARRIAEEVADIDDRDYAVAMALRDAATTHATLASYAALATPLVGGTAK